MNKRFFTKAKGITLFIVFLMICMLILPMTVSAAFFDLDPSHWCYEKILEFYEKGYFDGYQDGTFRPDNPITRAEFVKIVNNFFGFHGSNSEIYFSDVSSNDWFEPFVKEAAYRKYINGYYDGTFRPNNYITRQDAIVILARILKIDEEVYDKNHKNGLKQYKDRDLVEDWAYKAVQSYTVHGFVKGKGEDVIRPLDYLTRAELVSLLNVVEKKVEVKRSSSGSSSSPRATEPVITVYGENDVEIPIEQEWVGRKDAAKYCDEQEETLYRNEKKIYEESLGAYVGLSTTQEGASLFKTVDGGKPEEYNERFFLTDGIYNISAYATKSGYRQSTVGIRTVRIDTKAPEAVGEKLGELRVAHEQKVSIHVFDPETEGEESKLNESTLQYKWVKIGGRPDNNLKWEPLSLDENGFAELTAPSKYGEYLLAVSAYDNAGNYFGCFKDTLDEDVRTQLQELEESTKIHFGFVLEKGECFKPLKVTVGNNRPTAVDDYVSVGMNGEILIDVLANDYDVDGDCLSIKSPGSPAFGTTEISEGKIKYKPNRNARGTDCFRYKISDGDNDVSFAYVYINILGLNVETDCKDIVNEGLKLFKGETKSIRVSLSENKKSDYAEEIKSLAIQDLLILNIEWKKLNRNVIGLNEDGTTANVRGKKVGTTVIKISAELSNDIIAICFLDVDVIPTKVKISHVYDDNEYSTAPTEIKDKKVGDVVNVLNYADTNDGYYSVDSVTQDTIVVEEDTHLATIYYKRNIANVTFLDWDNKILKEEKVPYGEGATPPDDPVRKGYLFMGWDKKFSKIVVPELTIFAKYAQNDFTPPEIVIEGTPLYIDDTDSLNPLWGYNWNIKIRASDANDEVKVIKYIWNQSPDAVDMSTADVITSGTIIKKPVLSADTGLYYLHVYAEDYFENSDYIVQEFNVDRTAPEKPFLNVTTKSGGKDPIYQIEIDTEGIEINQSGLDKIEYCIIPKDPKGQKEDEFKKYEVEFEYKTKDHEGIKVRLTDKVGNYVVYEFSENEIRDASMQTTLDGLTTFDKTTYTNTTEDNEEVKEQLDNLLDDKTSQIQLSTIDSKKEINKEGEDSNMLNGEYNENLLEENDNEDNATEGDVVFRDILEDVIEEDDEGEREEETEEYEEDSEE